MEPQGKIIPITYSYSYPNWVTRTQLLHTRVKLNQVHGHKCFSFLSLINKISYLHMTLLQIKARSSPYKSQNLHGGLVWNFWVHVDSITYNRKIMWLYFPCTMQWFVNWVSVQWEVQWRSLGRLVVAAVADFKSL